VTKRPLVPRNHRGRLYERVGLNIRDFAGVPLEEALDPFSLASYVKIRIVVPRQIRALSPLISRKLTREYGGNWSAVTIELPNGERLCIMNPMHTAERIRATLMEEIAHVILGHKCTNILTAGGGLAFREYHASNEQVAYGVGAAALVPYSALVARLQIGHSPETIARNFNVSVDLVLYRIKITMLWRVYRRKAS
jgi:uncharacterized protein DUF955